MLRIFYSHNGGEFVNSQLTSFLKDNGVLHTTSEPYTPQHNPVAEQRNRTLVEATRTSMIDMSIPLTLWDEIMISTCQILNSVLSVKSKTSPFELWNNQRPKLKLFQTLGSKAVVLNNHSGPSKLSEKGIKGILVGFDLNLNSYKIYLPKIGSIVCSKHVKIFKNVKPTNISPFSSDSLFNSLLENDSLTDILTSPTPTTSQIPDSTTPQLPPSTSSPNPSTPSPNYSNPSSSSPLPQAPEDDSSSSSNSDPNTLEDEKFSNSLNPNGSYNL